MAKSAQPAADRKNAGNKPADNVDAAAAPPSYPGLKAAVIVMGILLVAGFIVVFATIAYRSANPRTDRAAREGAAGPAFETVRSLVPRDAVIGAMALDGDRLAVQIVGEDGMEIIMFDVRRGRETGRISLAPE